MQTLNRSVAIIRPKKPFIAWANACEYEGRAFSMDYFEDFHSMAILIPYYDSITANKSRKYILEIWDEIFNEVLNRWNKDQSSWPKDRSVELFKKWFKVEFLHTVIDSLAEN
jgi:hypothetical protein